MSRFVVLVSAVAFIALGAFAFWQHQQISEERNRTSVLQQSLAAMETRVSELENEGAQLREANTVFKSESEQLRQKLAAQTGENASSPSAAASQPEKADSEGAAAETKGGFMDVMAKMYKDPESRKAMRGQQAMGIMMMYADLAKELGLATEDANMIIELLTDRQLELTAKSMDLMTGGVKDDTKIAEVGGAVDTTIKDFNRQIENVLGAERYKKFQDYERTIGDRAVLNQIQQQFSARGFALDDSQRQTLLQTMVDERLKTPPTPWEPNSINVAEQIKTINSDEALTRHVEQQRQLNARVLSRARAFLSPDQLDALEQSQQQMLNMQEVGMKMGRQMLNK